MTMQNVYDLLFGVFAGGALVFVFTSIYYELRLEKIHADVEKMRKKVEEIIKSYIKSR